MTAPSPKGARWLRVVVITAAVLAVVSATVGLAGPPVARWVVRARVLPRVASRLGVAIAVDDVAVGLRRLRLSGVVVRLETGEPEPLARIAAVVVRYDFWALLRRRVVLHEVLIDRPEMHLIRRADATSNLDALIARRRSAAGPRQSTAKGGVRLHRVRLRDGRLEGQDQDHGIRFAVERIDGTVAPGDRAHLVLQGASVHSDLVPSALRFSRVEVRRDMGSQAQRLPSITLSGGRVRLLPRLGLSGIEGTVQPSVGQAGQIDIALTGSYGGAEAKLWHATGTVDPAQRHGELRVVAKRFELARIESILRQSPVIMPRNTSVSSDLVLRYDRGAFSFDGGLAVEGLNLFHPGLARVPVLDLSATLQLAGRYADRVLELQRLEVRSRGVSARLQGRLDRSGPFPAVTAALQVPPVKCQQVLQALPGALVPTLQGFELRGLFTVDLHTTIDFSKLDELELGGRVGIDRCKVTAVPEQVSAERLAQPFEHTVETAPGETQTIVVGPENPDFTPYEMISPYLIAVFLTTEDAAFFRHRGFIPSQFGKALARNLKRASFSLGASTITMQTVKNVLLSHEKTLARKLQELFLVWYLEQNLSKERLMEIYLNAIEFGPGIYGIGQASRHYFGKHPIEISPLEAAFLGTILPSPRRRYVQYCRGELSPRWDRYVRRVLRRMHIRGNITDAAYAVGADEVLVFRRDFEQMSERACLQRIETLGEAWQAEARQRIREAVLRAAPHQLDKYLPPES